MDKAIVAYAICILMISTFLVHSGQAQEQIRLETTSEEGTFLIVVMWEPNDLGRDNIFTIRFIEPETGSELEDIRYNFVIQSEETGEQVVRRIDQISLQQSVWFAEVGSYSITFEDIEGLGEDASLAVQVTPEFSTVLMITIVLAVSSVVGLARLKETNLFRGTG